jgi:uncharacterized membrane protein YeaQ/YmgE (transglycosylase-associated protein family)
MGMFTWMIVGLVAGAIGKVLHPGQDGKKFFRTMFLGIIGGLLGGSLGEKIFGTQGMTGFNLASIGHAVAGSIVVLLVHRLLSGNKNQPALPNENKQDQA